MKRKSSETRLGTHQLNRTVDGYCHGRKGGRGHSELFLFKRENGAWKIHRYIFTASAPPPQAK